MSLDLSHSHWLETYKSLITLSTEGFRFLALANGGAAVALLAYLGKVAGRQGPVSDLRWAMLAFLIGLGFCGFSMLFAYLTQLRLLSEIVGSERRTVHPILLWPAILFFVASLMRFGVGSWDAVISFH